MRMLVVFLHGCLVGCLSCSCTVVMCSFVSISQLIGTWRRLGVLYQSTEDHLRNDV